jgi:hypothetical protein
MEYLKNTFGYYFLSNNNTILKSESKIQNNPDCKIESIKDNNNNNNNNNNKFDTQKFDNSILSTINSILFYKKNISNNSSDDECDDNCECKN